MRRKTPQEKKQLSYAKDRRNCYCANDKASRKRIPAKRAQSHRTNRHHDRQALHVSTGPVDLDRSEHTEQRLLGRRPLVFRKWPDRPLGEHVGYKLAGRK
jgi:hypothetical protein